MADTPNLNLSRDAKRVSTCAFRRIAAALIASTLTGVAAATPADKYHWTTGPYLNLVTGKTTERFIIDGKGAERFDAENSWRCEPGQSKATCVVDYEQNEANGGGEHIIIDLPAAKSAYCDKMAQGLTSYTLNLRAQYPAKVDAITQRNVVVQQVLAARTDIDCDSKELANRLAAYIHIAVE